MHETTTVSAGDAAPAPLPRSAVLARTVGGVAVIAVAGAGIGAAMATDVLSSFGASRLIALGIAVAGGVMAVRWVRGGVRRQLREGAAAKVAEFGGGLYGALAFATLLYIEAMDLAGDVAGAGSVGAFFGSLSFGWLMAQAMESVGFAIRAAMWPWYWFSELGPGVAGLVAGGVWALHGVLPGLWERAGDWWHERYGGGVAGAEETP